MTPGARPAFTGDELRRAFDAPEPLTLGLEEELMLLDSDSLDLAPCARELMERVGDDERFKPEMPAAQFEIVTPPRSRVSDVVADLHEARRDLAAAAEGLVRLATAGVHPFAAPEGELNPGERYERTAAEYGAHARHQLVFALQVHVAPGSATRALAVYNGLRSYLPEIAALAANAPFHGGEDTGLASVRPTISARLPRQGVPPPLSDWDQFAAELRWGAAAGSVVDPGAWWWELRPNPRFGTLELRVPDAQTTVAEAAGVAAFVHCLVAELCERHESGDELAAAPSWRIAENRWWAARDGLGAELADLVTGERRPVRERLREVVERLAPQADRLGCRAELDAALCLVEANGAVRQRAVAAGRGDLRGVVAWLAERWLA